MRSRAISFTAFVARNTLRFFLAIISCCHSATPAGDAIMSTSLSAMEERDFFDERPDKKTATLNCPHCHQSADYEIGWIVRTKKRNLPPRADDRDRARFAKARSYMLRRDDLMVCKNMRCRKRFEISGVQSVVFTD